MKIIKSWPPNKTELAQFFPLNLSNYKPIFPWGEDIIYNPHEEEIPPDVMFHEQIHAKQQIQFMSPELWWSKYIWDREFRLSQEVEAYAKQLEFVKKTLNAKAVKEALDDFADNLSSPLYQLKIPKYKAHSLIRHYS